MNNSESATSREIKQVMRTAMIGVKPADLIMLKGYLRVLLRLEADLEWVPATHPEVDLYVINDEFRNSTSVIKLLKAQSNDKVLYVRRSENGEGLMMDNLIILPLQSLKDLSSWLYRSLPFLQMDNQQQQHNSPKDTTTTNTTNSALNTEQSRAESITIIEPRSNNSAQTSSISQSNINGLIELIKTVHERPEGLYELVCDQGKIALVNLARQRIWLVGEGSVTPNASWRFQKTTRAVAPDIARSTDLFQWLWQQAWHAPDNLLSLVSDEEHYQLRFWPKPRMTTSRKELIHLLTVLESQSLVVRDLASQANTSVIVAKKVVAGLLLAGGLQPDSYQHIVEKLKPDNKQTSTINIPSKEQVKPAPPAPKPKRSLLDDILARRSSGNTATDATQDNRGTNSEDNVKQEKLGFLAKLRRKLGL